jgi:Flp pilus assembly protein TadG
MARMRKVDGQRRPGAAAVELAVLLPFLCFIFVIAVDYARIYYYSLTMENAARNGAYFASDYPGLYSFTTAADVTLADLTNMSPTPQVDINYGTAPTGPFTSPTPITAGYVEVRVTWTFYSITSFPGVPNTTTLIRTCRMQMAPIEPSF